MSAILKAIRAKCLDCCASQPGEVRDCHLTACALHPYRMGTNPFRKVREFTDSQRAELSERLASGRRSAPAEIQGQAGKGAGI